MARKRPLKVSLVTPLPRMTTRRGMIAVAIVGTLLWLHHRSDRLGRLARRHGSLSDYEIRGLKEGMEARYQRKAAMSDWHRRMAVKKP